MDISSKLKLYSNLQSLYTYALCALNTRQHGRPVRRGGSLGSYEPPSSTCGKQKSEPNHFVAVQDLIEGSELEASLKRLEVPSYTLYAPHCLPFCYDIIG